MNALFSTFWWGHTKGLKKKEGKCVLKRGMLYAPQCNGGLGLRHMEDFNRALFPKFSWELAQNKESLCTNVFKKKYLGMILGSLTTLPSNQRLGEQNRSWN